MFTTPIWTKDGRRTAVGEVAEGQVLRRNGEFFDGANLGVTIAHRVLRSPLPGDTVGLLLAADAAYFIYLGQTNAPMIPKYVECYCIGAGLGLETAELGLFSSPSPPNKSAQVLSKLVSSASLSTLLSIGVKRNSAAFATPIKVGTHLWAGMRSNLAATQPTILSLFNDMGQGQVLTTATAGALTGAGPWTGSIITASAVGICPDLRATLD